MYCHKPQQTYQTTNGDTLVIVPRPSLLGVILDGDATPKAVKYPNHHYLSDGWTYYSTLKGINNADYDLIKPVMVLYELGDGTLLQADPELFENSEMASHNAAQSETACFIHQVNKLRFVEMPEFEVVPVFDLSDF